MRDILSSLKHICSTITEFQKESEKLVENIIEWGSMAGDLKEKNQQTE